MTRTDGPISTEYGSRCSSGEQRCKHFAVHDWHYFYCAAQPVAGQTYPWPGAGTQLHHYAPNGGCPFTQPKEKP